MCIRDRYQRRVRGRSKTNTMDLVALPSNLSQDWGGPRAVVFSILFVLVGAFRKQIDDRAHGWLLHAGAKVPAFEKLEARNEFCRKHWVTGVGAMQACMFTFNQEAFDAVQVFFMFIVIPLAFATYPTDRNLHFGHVPRVGLLGFMLLRLLFPNRAVPEETLGERMLFFAVFHFAYVEINSAHMSCVILNHLTCNLFVAVLCKPVAGVFPALSVGMLALFCIRRFLPERQRIGLQTDALSTGISRCAHLASLVLESGDELCTDNIQILQEILRIGGGWDSFSSPDQAEDAPSTTGSASATGVGTGGGILGADAACAEADLQVFLETDEFLEEAAPAAEGSPLIEASPSPRDLNLPAYSVEMVRMSFDAMAQVELQSGIVLWSNHAFEEMCHVLGSGDVHHGLRALQHFFLRQVPPDLHHEQMAVPVNGATVDVWSATWIVGQPRAEVVLWVLHRPLARALSLPRGPEPGPSEMEQSDDFRSGSGLDSPAEAELVDPSRPFPMASAFADPYVKVHSGEEHCSQGRGRRQVLLLWHKYGKRRLQPPGGTE
eukprot:TRINITY_DN485_c0_g1_i2.p1 TRINITY_DN485_c0_g1~~TRINITY_DN485_c0_g1_i2.p1  ORF type:complete len:548 (+),score=100.81 TRINITY_DN485_c0_g1_i2:171-1814(+)